MDCYQEDDLLRIKELLQHAGEFIAYFELTESKMLEWRQEIEQQAARLQQQQEALKNLTEKALAQIEQHRDQGINKITDQLNEYDPHLVQRVAHESCEQVKNAAQDAVSKSHKLLHMFQIRFNFFAVISTILTAFIVVLYLNGELPWEMHHQAKNERQAGRALLQAWPQLSQEEKAKIISSGTHS